MDNRNGPSGLQATQPSTIGLTQSALNIQSTMQSTISAPTSMQTSLNLPSSISIINSINSQNLTSIASIRNSKIDEIPHNLVVHRLQTGNGIDLDHIYRNPSQLLRNGIQEQYRRDSEVSSPLNNHENFLNRRVSEYDQEDHSVPQTDHIGRDLRPLELSEARLLDDKRIIKPAPLQARLVSLVETDMKEPMKRFYVLPSNTLDKKIVFIKNEPSEPVQVSTIFTVTF